MHERSEGDIDIHVCNPCLVIRVFSCYFVSWYSMPVRLTFAFSFLGSVSDVFSIPNVLVFNHAPMISFFWSPDSSTFMSLANK